MALLDTFPVSFKVAGRRIVVVGGGIEALNKTRLALKTSADVSVWARAFDPGFDALSNGRLTLNRREKGLEYHLVGTGWLDNVALVFIADPGADGVFAEAAARDAGIPVNVVDQPKSCDFYTPAIVDRAPVSVAISTEGAAPILARRVRASIETILAPELGALTALAGSLRETVAARLPDGTSRRRFYEKLAGSAEIEAELASDPDLARRKALDLLESFAGCSETGSIAFVGIGPGAEDLLTLRAQRLLQAADIVVHDGETPDSVIELGRRDAERLKLNAGVSPIGAAENGEVLVRLAKEGKRVVRLVSGDVRGSGVTDMEIAAARRAGLFCSVVPGISMQQDITAAQSSAQRVA